MSNAQHQFLARLSPLSARAKYLLPAVGLLTVCQALQFVPQAHAAVGCRSDPVLVVNGAIVDVVSTLSASAASIRELDYTVTVPTGSLLGKLTLTAGIGFPEKVNYIFSSAQAWGTMTIAATVVTAAAAVPFQTNVQATTLTTGAVSASGMSNTTVVVYIAGQLML